MTLHTIGHSTRTADEFASLLHRNGVRVLADIRSFPGSRRCPHFGSAEMAARLAPQGIAYVHLPALGGRRTCTLGDASPNGAWRNLSFRNFADHMQGAEFDRGMWDLFALAHSRSVAMMCSEAVPWRCHRQLVSDAAVARGWTVLHITGTAEPKAHNLTPFALAEGARVTYPTPLAAAGEVR